MIGRTGEGGANGAAGGRGSQLGEGGANGAAGGYRRQRTDRRVRVAIVGVGNCASSLVQGVHYYGDADPAERVPGLMHVDLAGYHVGSLEFVAAFDVDAKKVGRDLAEAIVAPPNNTVQFAEVPPVGIEVLRGPTLDGFGEYYADVCEESELAPVDVAEELRRARTDVLVCYLPVGAERAARHYAQAALDAGVAVVNCLPVFIASEPDWAQRFTDAGVPIIGDDIKSQVGATITHRVLTRLFEDRGVTIDRTYQLNFGGNMDFMNMLERKRLTSKKISKTQSVTSQMGDGIAKDSIHIGPSDHVPWLEDRKWAYLRMEGRNFGDVPLNVELKLEVWDSPNSAGVVIDAVRCAKVALDRGIGGPLLGPSSYFMKSPPAQFADDVCRQLVGEFIAEPVSDAPPQPVEVTRR
ncbi:MAG: inositol-3-phosphate synthase [Egibacteraceae bacterium]